MLVAALLLSAGPAEAGPFDLFHVGITYCVGGFDANGYARTDACELPAQASVHGAWHFHLMLFDGSQCWSCWDEVDDTCETGFWPTQRSWQPIDPFDDRCANHAAADSVFSHVIDGQTVVAPPPPAALLSAQMDGVDPGPHAPGDEVRVVGAVRDGTGALRPVSGGRFELTTADGTVTSFQGTRRSDGTIEANVRLPASAAVSARFIPDAPTLQANERMGSPSSNPLALEVDNCTYRGRILAPAPGEALASGEAVTLRASLWDRTDSTPISPPSAAALQFIVTPSGDAPTVIPASAALDAKWTPPASPTTRRVDFAVTGTAGGLPVCSARSVSTTFSDLGLAFNDSALPSRCYTGMDCSGTVHLARPSAGPARAKVDALLTEPGLQVVLIDNGQELWRKPARPDDEYAISEVYSGLGSHSLSIHLIRADGSVVAMPDHQVTVRPPLKVVVPTSLDLGSHNAGDPWTSTCTKLDMSASQAAEEHEWELHVEGTSGCSAMPVLGYSNAAGVPDFAPLDTPVRQPAFDPKHREFQICLKLPRCSADEAPAGAKLLLRPLTPAFADQAREISLHWAVNGRPFYACHGWWLWPSAAGLSAILFVFGVVRPARFSPSASIRIAGTEAGVKRAGALSLRELPGARPRLFRDARLGLHLDGNVSGNLRAAPVVLRATRDRGTVLEGAGAVERFDSTTRKWKPVEDLCAGHAPSPRAIYRVGTTHFQLEPR